MDKKTESKLEVIRKITKLDSKSKDKVAQYIISRLEKKQPPPPASSFLANTVHNI